MGGLLFGADKSLLKGMCAIFVSVIGSVIGLFPLRNGVFLLQVILSGSITQFFTQIYMNCFVSG